MSILGVGVDAIAVISSRSENENESITSMKKINLNKIVIGHYQPRKKGVITKESLQDLIASIKEQGVLQPIIVRKTGEDIYELIAGERRYRSAYEANLKEIPCVIKNVNEKDAYAIALIENIQREQLSLLEESESLLKLKEEHFLRVDDVSKLIGKPRTTVANLIRVASMLSPEGKKLWENGCVDYGHIRAVIILNHERQNIVLQYVADNKLPVRETEKLIREEKYFDLHPKETRKAITKPEVLNNELLYIIKKLKDTHLNASIKMEVSGRVKVKIEFKDSKKALDSLKKIQADFHKENLI